MLRAISRVLFSDAGALEIVADLWRPDIYHGLVGVHHVDVGGDGNLFYTWRRKLLLIIEPSILKSGNISPGSSRCLCISAGIHTDVQSIQQLRACINRNTAAVGFAF